MFHRDRCSLEIRAVVHIPKGTEILRSYLPTLYGRAERQEYLETYKILCQCESCALPDDSSDTLDSRIHAIRSAELFVEDASKKDCRSKSKKELESDSMHALQLLEHVSSSLLEMPLFQRYLLFIPLDILAFLGREDRILKVAEALLPVYKRYLGDHRGLGSGEDMVEILSRLLENPRCHPFWRNWEPAGSQSVRKRIKHRLQKATSDLISCIQKYP
jgi:hypothetical protein